MAEQPIKGCEAAEEDTYDHADLAEKGKRFVQPGMASNEIPSDSSTGWDLKLKVKPTKTRPTDKPNEVQPLGDPVCDNVLDEISRIDKPCVIVAIAELYRTGKSYLMNRLADAHEGFALGDTIESTTKGIWVWCRDHPEQKDMVLILLDTEVLGDVEKISTFILL
ncbi:GBP5-like protein [Mya arenaria]|uniref:GBP5-like protein n=1 Tax=Mya arenaria TaxID=6604 RepID=A0ABY7EXB4_MYAAR|nr:GBP5-like protein [Mya arenaria]